ncbi:MAG: acyltransferase family protein, partial [Bacteroidota bacterium]|nr:acyltransferase family protein [Bacteroidota bacterium]
ERITYIDLIKGVGIILVVIGHLPIDSEFRKIIFSFHMPLFFFVSGLFHKQKDPKDFILNKAKRLLIPYVFFFLLSEFFTLAFDYPRHIAFQSRSFFEILNGQEYFTYNVPLWFLLCLFEVSILYYFIQRYLEGNKKLQTIAVLIFSALGYGINKMSINIPYFLDSAFSSLIFYHAGSWFYNEFKAKGDNLFKGSWNILSSKASLGDEQLTGKGLMAGLSRCVNTLRRWTSAISGKHKAILLNAIGLSVLFAVFLDQAYYSGPLDVRANMIPDSYLSYLITSFTGILLVVFLCKAINSISVIDYWGKNSLVIMSTHIPLFLFVNYLNDQVFHVNGNSWMYEVIRLSLTFSFCTALIEILNRYCPKLIGK